MTVRLLLDKLIPTYVRTHNKRERDGRSREGDCLLRFASRSASSSFWQGRVNQNVRQATYTGTVTFPFSPQDMPGSSVNVHGNSVSDGKITSRTPAN